MKISRNIPLLGAIAVFVIALLIFYSTSRTEGTVPVLVAARDLPAGHTITAGDVRIDKFPQSTAPEGGFFETEDGAIGKTLATTRHTGDIIYRVDLGTTRLMLNEGEAGIGIRVSDACGFGGLIKEGDLVGLTAAFSVQSNVYSKYLIGGLRVLYVSPEFKAVEPVSTQSSSSGLGTSGSSSSSKRKTEGTVMLAIPVGAQIVTYDWSVYGFPEADNPKRAMYAVDLIPALNSANNVSLCLILEAAGSVINSSGAYLPNFLVIPATVTPMPTATLTPTPEGFFQGQ